MNGTVFEEFRMKLPGYGDALCRLILSHRVRRISIRVLEDKTISLVVPSLSTVSEAKSFLYEQRSYVLRRLRAIEKTEAESRNSFANVEYPATLPLLFCGGDWSVQYEWMPVRDLFCEVQQESHRFRIYGAIFHPEAIMKCIGNALKQLALISLKPLLDAWSTKMGMPYGNMSVRLQRGCWGSCSGRCNISLNAQLLFFPPDIVEYVLIHELCHTVEHNHSSAFWALVRRYCPDYMKRRKRQKEMYLALSGLCRKWEGA